MTDVYDNVSSAILIVAALVIYLIELIFRIEDLYLNAGIFITFIFGILTWRFTNTRAIQTELEKYHEEERRKYRLIQDAINNGNAKIEIKV